MLDTVLTTESLVYVGLSFYAAGFLVRDELILRTLVLIGSLFWLAYYFLRPEPVWNSIYAEGVLIGINLVLICTIALERTTFAMNERARTLFGHFNRLTPGQFRKLLRDARWMETPIATDIIKEGRVPDRLYFIDAPQYTIVRGGHGASAESQRVSRMPAAHPEGYIEAFANFYRDAAEITRAHRSGMAVDPARAAQVPDVVDGARGVARRSTAAASFQTSTTTGSREWTSYD